MNSSKRRYGLILLLPVLFFLNAHAQQQQIPFEPYDMEWRTGHDTDFDLSGTMEKPAGKDGFVQIKDGHFYTADGDRLRIWGINIGGGACFPEKEEAEKVAAFLARHGINGVRFHFMDSDWGQENSIFDYDTTTTRYLHPGQLDKFDYFVSELKKQGIYSNINLNVGRNFRPADGVPDSDYLGLAKGATIFDDRLIMLQKEYARQLLTHKNPYTGNRYVNEPALIIVEIVNENSLVEAWYGDRLTGTTYSENPSTWSGVPPYYAKELTRKYNKWLRVNRSADQIQAIAEEAGRNADGLIPRMASSEFDEASKLRFYAEASFIMHMDRKFFTGMYHYLKSTLGLNAHVVGTRGNRHNSGYALLSSLTQTDVMDGHSYWQHPSHVEDPETGETRIRFDNTPMVNEPSQSTVAYLSRTAVKGKPYTVSESNNPFPNEYGVEGIPILAAYSQLQDWDGIYYHSLEGGDPSTWNHDIPNPFTIYHDPTKMATMAAAGLMFRRGDVAMADSVIYRDYSRTEIIEGIRKQLGEPPFNTPGFHSALPLVHRTRARGFYRQHGGYPDWEMPNPIISETGQLTWKHGNEQGLVTVNTPKTQAMIGFVEDSGSELPHLDVDIVNEFCSLILTSTESEPIAEADELLFTAATKMKLTNMEYTEDRQGLVRWGKKPVQIQPVTGKIELKGLEGVQSAELLAIGGDGNEMHSKTVDVDPNGVLSFKIGSPATPLYMIRFDR
jgi:hypothetical protein